MLKLNLIIKLFDVDNMHCYLCTVVVVQYTKKENLFMICYFFCYY